MAVDTCKRELELAHRRNESLRAQTMAAADAAKATAATAAGPPPDSKQSMRHSKTRPEGDPALDPRVPAGQANGLQEADFEWMPAILAHLDGDVDGQGSGEEHEAAQVRGVASCGMPSVG